MYIVQWVSHIEYGWLHGGGVISVIYEFKISYDPALENNHMSSKVWDEISKRQALHRWNLRMDK